MTEKLEYRNTRRGNHEGSIYQTGNGRWRGQITLGYKSDGRPMRQSFTGTTREEVARQIAVASAAVLGGEKFTNDTNVLFGDYADFWLRNIKRYEINTKTYAWYINLLDNHIRPVIGGYPLGKISTSQLQQMLNQAVQDKGQSIRMAEGIRTTLKQIFGFACQNDILKSNPADNTKILRSQNTAKRVRKQQKALSIEERSHLLQALEGESILYPAIIMLLFTGMRVGELLALQWQHIALDTKTVTIEQALVRRHETDRAGKLQKELHMVDAPKTESSYRTLRLPEIVISALQAWKTYAKETLHLELQPEAYVFCNSKTGKLRTYTGFRSSYYHFLDRHQLDRSRFHFHALRHTFATMLLEGGIQPKIAQEILGHASVTTTLNIYSHVVPEVLTGVASMLDDIHESMTQGTYTPKISVEKT